MQIDPQWCETDTDKANKPTDGQPDTHGDTDTDTQKHRKADLLGRGAQRQTETTDRCTSRQTDGVKDKQTD